MVGGKSTGKALSTKVYTKVYQWLEETDYALVSGNLANDPIPVSYVEAYLSELRTILYECSTGTHYVFPTRSKDGNTK